MRTRGACAGRKVDASRTQRRHGAGDGDRRDVDFGLSSIAEARPRAGERPVSRPGRAFPRPRARDALRGDPKASPREPRVSGCDRRVSARETRRGRRPVYRRARGAGSRPPVRRADFVSRGAPRAGDAGCAAGEVGRARVRRRSAVRRRCAEVNPRAPRDRERGRDADSRRGAPRDRGGAVSRALALARRAGAQAGGVQAEAEGGSVRVRRGPRRRARRPPREADGRFDTSGASLFFRVAVGRGGRLRGPRDGRETNASAANAARSPPDAEPSRDSDAFEASDASRTDIASADEANDLDDEEAASEGSEGSGDARAADARAARDAPETLDRERRPDAADREDGPGAGPSRDRAPRGGGRRSGPSCRERSPTTRIRPRQTRRARWGPPRGTRPRARWMNRTASTFKRRDGSRRRLKTRRMHSWRLAVICVESGPRDALLGTLSSHTSKSSCCVRDVEATARRAR